MTLAKAAPFVLLASLLAGCGSSAAGDASDPEETLAAAATRTLEEDSARISYSLHNRLLGRPPGQGTHGELAFGSRAARLSVDGDGHLYTPSHWYVHHRWKDPITGKPWVGYSRERFDVYEDDRLRLVPYLAAGAVGIGAANEDTVDGRTTTRYQATVDVDRALTAVPESGRPLAERVLEEALLGQRARVDFWLDDQGRLRRIRVQIPPGRTYSRTDPDGDSISLKSGPGAATSTFDFIAFGVPVDATPPPADEVGDPLNP